MTESIRHFGAHRDAPDPRDRAFSLPPHRLKDLPASVDLRPHCPPVYDQRPLHSCTANAAAAAVQYERKRHGLAPDFTPSRLFIYYNERRLLGTAHKDAGAPLREAIKVLAKHGDCPEHHWPYEAAKVNVEPPHPCYRDAVRYRDMVYERVPQDLAHMKGCLAARQAFVLAFGVYESSETKEAAKACTMPIPKEGEKFLGNHAVMAVGYDDAHGHFILRNSWGPHWGREGHFFLPYRYLTDPKLAGDLWTLRLATG
ncbi:MAG TPA: C1 family peptidase [Gammaproteobacteria bacterium]